MKKSLILLFILSTFFGFTQEDEVPPMEPHHHEHSLTEDPYHEHPKCEKLMDVFKSGYMAGRVRYYFMNTNHTQHGENYYANAIGGALAYHTAVYYGFSAGLSGIFVYNIGSSHFHDTLLSVNELELFDVTHPENRNDLDRLEELYIAYEWKKNKIKYGKQDVSTPLVNMQDTRMKPYVFKGIWGNFWITESTTFNAGWFTEASPRSTTHWYPIAGAIGLYGEGQSTTGLPSDYQGFLSSKGMGILGLEDHRRNLNSQAWFYHINNILNTYYLQFDYQIPLQHYALITGIQGVYQQPHNKGGSPDGTHVYYDPTQTTTLVSGRLGFKTPHQTYTVNATTISNSGRFIFPREFGREQFYTTLPRGRIEGLGGASQLVLKAETEKLFDEKFNGFIAFGRTFTPGRTNFELNKYATADYDHFAANLLFKPRMEEEEGLTIRLLYVLFSAYHLPKNPSPDFHKQYHQINLIANIKF